MSKAKELLETMGYVDPDQVKFYPTNTSAESPDDVNNQLLKLYDLANQNNLSNAAEWLKSELVKMNVMSG